jgi:hypothetical protein
MNKRHNSKLLKVSNSYITQPHLGGAFCMISLSSSLHIREYPPLHPVSLEGGTGLIVFIGSLKVRVGDLTSSQYLRESPSMPEMLVGECPIEQFIHTVPGSSETLCIAIHLCLDGSTCLSSDIAELIDERSRLPVSVVEDVSVETIW